MPNRLLNAQRILVVKGLRVTTDPWDVNVSTVSFAVRHLWLAFLVFGYVCRFMPTGYVMRHLDYIAYWLFVYAGMSFVLWFGLYQQGERPKAYYWSRMGRIYRFRQYVNHWVVPYPLGYKTSRRIWGIHAIMILGLFPPYALDLFSAWQDHHLDKAVDLGVAALFIIILSIVWYLFHTHEWGKEAEEEPDGQPQ